VAAATIDNQHKHKRRRQTNKSIRSGGGDEQLSTQALAQGNFYEHKQQSETTATSTQSESLIQQGTRLLEVAAATIDNQHKHKRR
jgi:hypothetical protein